MDRMGGMSMPVGDITPELVLIAGSVAVLLLALTVRRDRQRWPAWAALGVLAATAASTVVMLGGEQSYTFFDTYTTDDAAVLGKLVVLAVTALTVLLSVEWMAADRRSGEYYALLLLSALGAVVLAGAADLMELVLGILLSSVTGYVLASYHRSSPRSTEAGVKYYLLGALTNAGLLYGVVLLFGLAATTTYAGLAAELVGKDPVALIAGAVLVVVGVTFKLGAVPAHPWVPDVAEGAPAPVSAFLTAAPKVGALIALARVVAIIPEDAVGWRPVIAVLAAATMTLGNLAALTQDDVRRLLGWSAVSQSGYGMMAIVALGRSDLAIASLLYFTAAYAFANLAAFGVVTELRGRTALADYAGLARTRPALTAALTIAFLSFVGVPPLAGFPAKLTLFGAAVDAGYTWLAVLAVINTVVSLAYYLRVLAPAYWQTAPSTNPVPVLGRTAAAATWAAVVAVVALGIGAESVIGVAHDARLLPW